MFGVLLHVPVIATLLQIQLLHGDEEVIYYYNMV